MHNLHLVSVRAQSPQEACDFVEGYIEDFGDENNWRTISGCVSQDDEVYCAGEERFEPDQDTNTIQKITDMVKRWIQEGNFYMDQSQEKLKISPDITTWTDTQDLWSLKHYVDHLYQKSMVRSDPENFNVFEDSYYSNEYSKNGLTKCNDGEDGKFYIVFVDMHD